MNDNRAPLDLTPAMETTRVEECNAVLERAELDLARIRAEGREVAYRRAEHQRQMRRTDRIAIAAGIMTVVGFWALIYATGGWRAIAGTVSIIAIVATVLAIVHWLAESWDRIGAILSGRP